MNLMFTKLNKIRRNTMKISLATNFDNELINQIKNYPVYEVYGKMKHDFIGGGRPDNTLSNIDKKIFESHVKKVREQGIRFIK